MRFLKNLAWYLFSIYLFFLSLYTTDPLQSLDFAEDRAQTCHYNFHRASPGDVIRRVCHSAIVPPVYTHKQDFRTHRFSMHVHRVVSVLFREYPEDLNISPQISNCTLGNCVPPASQINHMLRN